MNEHICRNCRKWAEYIIDGLCPDCLEEQTDLGEAILRSRGVPEEEIRDITKVGKGEMSVEEWNEKHQ